MATTNQVLKARVERGAALLDAEQPGWAPRIDVPTLDISGDYCILGQLYDDYGVGIVALGIGLNDPSYGFIEGPTWVTEYPRLLPLWREAIEARCGGDMTEARYFDRDGKALELLAWARLHNDMEYKRIAKDVLPDGTEVSTVWLGLDHNFGSGGPPLIFETMVFAGTDDGSLGSDLATERYATEVGAKAGHEAMVREWTK